MSASASSSSSSSSVPIAFQPCVSNNFLPIKLDGNNYPLWRAQIVPLLHSCHLLGFVNGKTQCPAAFRKDEAGELTDTVNPEYDAWIQQDQMILSWLHASLSSTVLATVAGSTSARQTWESLELRYANKVTADQVDPALAILGPRSLMIISAEEK